MTVFNQSVDFLPIGSELRVSIKPKDGLSADLAQHIISDMHVSTNRTKFIPVILRENLKISFSISNGGRIQKQLEPCKVEIPAISSRIVDSVNRAYQVISAEYEKRDTRGGTVYEYVYHKDTDDTWKDLEVRRLVAYQPHEEECNRVANMIRLGLNPFIRPLPEFDNILLSRLEKKQDLIVEILKSETQNLKTKVEELNKIIQSSALTAYKNRLGDFQNRLTEDIPETNGDTSWQDWIYNNRWLFGPQYGSPISKAHVGFQSIPDFLFPTPDGFIDILEIKLPKHEVIQESRSHRGAYRWSSEANEAIGQVVNYLYEMELHQLEIAKKISQLRRFSFTTLKPRAFILIGQSVDWGLEKREALRKMNFSLHGIEVLTYSELHNRGEKLIKMYSDFIE